MKTLKKQSGFVAVMMSLILMGMISAMTLFTVKSISDEQKVVNNLYREAQSESAGQSGLAFGVDYLNRNKDTIRVDSNNDGYMDTYSNAAVTNVAQSDGSSYTISYSNPVANNMNLIKIVSQGKSVDSLTLRSIQQLFGFYSTMQTFPQSPMITKGSVALSGNVTVSNTVQATPTIWSGGLVSLSGSAATQSVNGGGSSSTSNGGDIVQLDTNLSLLSNDAFFQNFFGSSPEVVASMADKYYADTGAVNYSSQLSGVTGQTIWISNPTGSATVNGNVTIGSPTKPVVLIVDSNLIINGNTTVYGVVYVKGNWTNTGAGTMNVNGSVLVQGNYTGAGTPNVTYDATVGANTVSQVGRFAAIPGSWRDF